MEDPEDPAQGPPELGVVLQNEKVVPRKTQEEGGLGPGQDHSSLGFHTVDYNPDLAVRNPGREVADSRAQGEVRCRLLAEVAAAVEVGCSRLAGCILHNQDCCTCWAVASVVAAVAAGHSLADCNCLAVLGRRLVGCWTAHMNSGCNHFVHSQNRYLSGLMRSTPKQAVDYHNWVSYYCKKE